MLVALVIPADSPGTNNFNQVPIGALYTATRLREGGHEVAFADLRRIPADGRDYRRLMSSDLVVVFSNDYDLAQCYPSLAPAQDCVRLLRGAGTAQIVACGSHATTRPLLTRQTLGVDGVVLGEYEFAVPELVHDLERGHPLAEVWPPSLEPAMATSDQLAALGSPSYELAPMDQYASEGFVDGRMTRVHSALVLANRGCPFACNFCYLLFGRRLRRRPVAATIAELRLLHREHGIDHFFFLDYTFTVDQTWVVEMCQEIHRSDLQVSWVCQTRVDCLDPDTLRQMRAAGCAGIWLGVESPELEQRRYLSKGRIQFSAIDQAVAMIRRAGMEVLTFVMVGLPNETTLSLERLNQWLEDSQVFYSLSTFQRRPGTPLAAATGLEIAEWSSLDPSTEVLGESTLRIEDLGWFFDYHERSPRRVANVMRRLATQDAAPV